jgi:hypothetical protein
LPPLRRHVMGAPGRLKLILRRVLRRPDHTPIRCSNTRL